MRRVTDILLDNLANLHRAEPDGCDLRALFAELSRRKGTWHDVLADVDGINRTEDGSDLDRYLCGTYGISQVVLNLDAAVSGRGNHRSALAFHICHMKGGGGQEVLRSPFLA
jgi:hypothetical protein